jgi:site-specific DNA recombinase
VALVYTRVSTGQQAEEGVSLDSQEAQCRFLAERTGLAVDRVFRDEGLSGSLPPAARPQMAALLDRRAELEVQGYEVVVITYDFSRVSRSVTDLLELVDPNRGGLLLSTVKESFDVSTPSGRLMRTMLAAINEFNREMTCERTKDALSHVKRRITAERAAGREPVKYLGQRRVEDIVAPEVVLAVHEAIFKDKLSQRRTVERLNASGLLTPRGSSKWNLDSVQRILHAIEAGKFDLATGQAKRGELPQGVVRRTPSNLPPAST